VNCSKRGVGVIFIAMYVSLSFEAYFIWKVNKAAVPDDSERPLMIYDINWNSGQLSQFFIGLKETSRAD
jgi:hypothetical protein